MNHALSQTNHFADLNELSPYSMGLTFSVLFRKISAAFHGTHLFQLDLVFPKTAALAVSTKNYCIGIT